ncbi:hypothetical protein EOPP23_19335 [Endozoicomonas sp. OPT23]|uniref:flavin-containing monooxygenase n=1 Tax=Endozoicomonas sp. OPT23 TaxID=2072845 RepID=UPI00129A8A09|nr:FAD-dependent oxidoreductase [Endozoicomonas sp. OPT23]MRI35123.1 hypothetical protein [Endozoicomonas sp. OPT23]
MPDNNKVAIIGAGPAGLITARELERSGLDITVYEQRDCLGGTWAIQPLDGFHDLRRSIHDIHSAGYPSLRSNFPKELMALPDQPFPDSLPLYPTASNILNHLQRFSDSNGLTAIIRFKHQFIGIEKNISNSQRLWRLKTSQGDQGLFSAIVFCTGRYGCPILPEIAGTDDFSGTIEHSLSYRGPDKYLGKRVALLGTGPSGEDLSREISLTASRVYVCAHKGSRQHYPVEKGLYGKGNSISRHADIIGVNDNTVFLEDGSQLDNIDHLILCTGYRTADSILSALPGCKLSSNGMSATPLYLNLFHPLYPELSITGVDVGSFPFILYFYQARVIARYLAREINLPTEKQRIFAAKYVEIKQSGRVSFNVRRKAALEQLRKLSVLANLSSPGSYLDNLAYRNALHRMKYPDCYQDTPWDEF